MTDLAAIRAEWERAMNDDMHFAVSSLRDAIPENPTRHFGLTHALNALIRQRAAVEHVRDLLALAERQQAEIAELRAALEPFASSYNADHWHRCLSLDNLRTARDALACAKEP